MSHFPGRGSSGLAEGRRAEGPVDSPAPLKETGRVRVDGRVSGTGGAHPGGSKAEEKAGALRRGGTGEQRSWRWERVAGEAGLVAEHLWAAERLGCGSWWSRLLGLLHPLHSATLGGAFHTPRPGSLA